MPNHRHGNCEQEGTWIPIRFTATEKAYLSDVDPRLNYEQAMELALLICHRMNRAGRKSV